MPCYTECIDSNLCFVCFVGIPQHGTPPLLIAAGCGNIHIIDVLMKKGAEIQALDKVCKTFSCCMTLMQIVLVYCNLKFPVLTIVHIIYVSKVIYFDSNNPTVFISVKFHHCIDKTCNNIMCFNTMY